MKRLRPNLGRCYTDDIREAQTDLERRSRTTRMPVLMAKKSPRYLGGYLFAAFPYALKVGEQTGAPDQGVFPAIPS